MRTTRRGAVGLPPQACAMRSPPSMPATPTGTAGCHDEDLWRRMLPAQVTFLGRHLVA